jgi:hypothetical protein
MSKLCNDCYSSEFVLFLLDCQSGHLYILVERSSQDEVVGDKRDGWHQHGIYR